MKPKRITLAAILSAALCAGIPPASGGVPVISGTELGQAIASQVETIAQWGQQIKAMYDQYATQIQSYMKYVEMYQKYVQMYQKAEQTLKALQGASNLGQIYDALPKNQLPPDIQNALNDVRGLANFNAERAKFPRWDGAPKANNLFDKLAGQKAAMKSVYNQTSARLQNIGNLMAKINQAKDPGDKEDLANRIAIEQATIAANIQAMEAYQKISQDEIRHAALEAKKEWACAQFNTQDTCF